MDRDFSVQTSTEALQLNAILARHGLDQYEQCLTENGFDTWETVTRITEADMSELGFRLGHRRKLQRAILEYKSSTTTKTQCLVTNFSLSSGGLPVIGAHPTEFPLPLVPAVRTKRPYRRHPRSDDNAPRKPKTAYVLFSEHVRRDPAINRLSFAEIAKEVGKRWGNLPQEEKVNIWEKPTADKMREYGAELEQYKKTESYQSYQTYLEDFRQGTHKPELTELFLLSQEEPQPALQGESDTTGPSGFNCFSSDTSSQHPVSPTESGMEEVSRVLNILGVNPQHFKFNAFPSEGITYIAVEAFLHGTGSLLYLWDHEEALDLVRSVYLPKRGSTQLHATEVFAMAAIGSNCDGETVTTSVREDFLRFFLSMLSLPSDMCDLRRMRLFTCLAICQFTNSVESARKLICESLILFEHQYDGLTARSIRTRNWEADNYVSLIRRGIFPRKSTLLVACLSKRRLPGEVCATDIVS
jgi:hypothetical protein